MRLQANEKSEALFQIWFTEQEVNEIVLLIDDEPVDEDFLRGLRKKLVKKRKQYRTEIRDLRVRIRSDRDNTTTHPARG